MSRSESLCKEAKVIQREAVESAKAGHHYRVVRKAHEAAELWFKAKLLEKAKVPAKTHDLVQLARAIGDADSTSISEEELAFLTQERIPSFYGAEEGASLESAYDESDSSRCLSILERLMGAAV